jgi:enoyl-CoA hydratase/carnithine racemase
VLIENYALLKKLNELQVPVIAAIRGVCIGAAFELALHCHFRLCAEDAILGLPESSFGVIPGLDGTAKMLELSCKAKTMELIMTGRNFNASDALKWQLVDRIFPKKILLDKAIELAKESETNYRKYNKQDYLKKL